MAVKAGEYPELRLKAWTSRVLTAYLAVSLHDLAQATPADQRDQELVLATTALAKLADWMLTVERYPRYLSAEQIVNLQRLCWESLVSIQGLVLTFRRMI